VRRPAPLDGLIDFAPLGRVALWSLAAVVLSIIVLAPPTRVSLRRILPIDPRSPVHAIALSLVTAIAVMLLGQLIAAHGRPVLLTIVEQHPEVAKRAAESPLTMLYGLVWTVPAALVAAGWPVVRTWRGALQRLGLTRPSCRQIAVAIGLALALVVAVQLLDNGLGRLFGRMHWPRTNEAAFEKLLGTAISGWGAAAVGISAGVGEELIVRGALQPRLGILVSALFFASLHAPQYGFDALISVFILGLVLGVVRQRSNTTCSAIVHGVYDFTVVLVAALGKH